MKCKVCGHEIINEKVCPECGAKTTGVIWKALANILLFLGSMWFVYGFCYSVYDSTLILSIFCMVIAVYLFPVTFRWVHKWLQKKSKKFCVVYRVLISCFFIAFLVVVATSEHRLTDMRTKQYIQSKVVDLMKDSQKGVQCNKIDYNRGEKDKDGYIKIDSDVEYQTATGANNLSEKKQIKMTVYFNTKNGEYYLSSEMNK